MLIRIGYDIEIESAGPVPLLMALSVHSSFDGRLIGEDRVRAQPAGEMPVHEYIDQFGNRIARLTAPGGPLKLWSDCVVEIDGEADLQSPKAEQQDVQNLPDDVLRYLLPSRYCDSDNLVNAAWPLFSGYSTGWARVQAISQFVHDHVTFGYQFGRANKTASEVYREKTGVCRDFAHLTISFCRAMNIPARYASGYLGDIGVPYSGPGDFCAWLEVYLGGKWHTFDARYNVPRAGRVLMVRGTDAADVAMITSFGDYKLTYFRVWTDEIDALLSEPAILDMLKTRPVTEPLVFPTTAKVA
tara:strand:+ start:20785 stop:21684 length:900 start_codon:yes stop_codon:yes gene_type:complete